MIKYLFFIALSASLMAAPRYKIDAFEDTFVLFALDAQAHQQYRIASDFFAELYKQTSKKEYLYQSLKMLEQANDIKELSKATKEAMAKLPDDEILKRFDVIALLKGGSFAEASQKAFVLTEHTPKAPDYLLYAEARLKLSDYEGAVSALKKAYAMGYDDTTAERIALIEYAQLGQKKEAIEFLKEHIGTHGNSVLIGKRLGSFYGDSGEYDNAASIYAETYESFGDASCAEEALKLYIYQKDYTKLESLLELSHLNDPMLLELYVRAKRFEKASELAMHLYEDEDNALYLAQSAVYKYEGTSDRNNTAVISDVIEKLKKATEDVEEPLYLNYLGYLMIDHDVNVTEGMGYVKRALDKQPDSPFYIDSLAWGYYKQGECGEAMRLIKQVESMIGSDEQEVKDHLNAIGQCKTKEKN